MYNNDSSYKTVVSAAFKAIKGWLPPAAVKKIKFLTKTNMHEYVSDENRLEEWGGTDPWQYVWEPEGEQTHNKFFRRNLIRYRSS